MNKNIFWTYRTREDLDIALTDPVESEILKTNSWRALTHWMMSAKYQNRPTSYYEQVVPLIFPALFEPCPEGCSDLGVARRNLLLIWIHFGWIEKSVSHRGWESNGDRSRSTEEVYLSMAMSNNPETRSRGDHLLNGSCGQKTFCMVQVNTAPAVEYLRSIASIQEFIGKPKKQIVEDLGIPLPLVKIIWGDLIDSQDYREALGRISGSRQRILKWIQNTHDV